MASSPNVAEKHKLTEQSYIQSLGSYVSGFSSYLPSGLKKQIYTTQPQDERDKVIWTSFDSYDREGKSRQCLVLGFVNGFQVWDIEEQPDNIFELVSKRDGAVKCARIVQIPLHPVSHGRLLDKHPCLALASAEDSVKFPKNAVRIYSLREQKEISTMKLRSEINTILCSKRMLLVALHDYIYGFDTVNMEKVFGRALYTQEHIHREPRGASSHGKSLTARPRSSVPCPTVALGSRWVAFPGKKVQTSKDQPASNVTINQIVDVAKYIGDVGRKTVSSYIYPDAQGTAPASPSGDDLTNAGHVIVYDTVSGKKIAHFKAHDEPLAALKFDPSGTLLVTTSISGYEFNVYQIDPSKPLLEAAHHIYTLLRGRTSATITDISFSLDSRWMAVSSARGTTHIYAINPEGGPVNIHTHIPSEPMASHEAPFLLHFSQPKLLSLNVCNRVKQPVAEESPEANPSTSSAFVSNPQGLQKLFTITHSGILAQYALKPHGPETQNPEEDPKTLHLTMEPTYYWDLSRRSSAAQALTKLRIGKDPENLREYLVNDPRWLSNVEITTHMPYDRPLWAGPQFTFKTFQRPSVHAAQPADLVADYSANANKIEIMQKPGTSNLSSDFSSPSATSADLERAIPMLPREKEETVKADINMAMSTPMELPKEHLVPSPAIQRESQDTGTRSESKQDKKPNEGRGKTIQLAPQPELNFYDGDGILED